MSDIPIKIKKEGQPNQAEIKKALNLNRIISGQKAASRSKQRWATFIFTAGLVLILLALAANFFWLKSKEISPYQKFIPEQATTVVFLKIDKLKDGVLNFLSKLEQDSSYFEWLSTATEQFLNQAGISAKEDLIPLFEQDLVFLVLPSANQKLNWAILAQIKSDDSLSQQATFGKIEVALRQNFGLNQLFYRQIKINSVSPLNQLERQYFYAQINNFIVISNHLTSLQDLIDRIIGK